VNEQIFFHDQYGPYQQRAAISVRDGGNGLPIHILMQTGDPSSATSNSMSISMAYRFRDNLNKAINAAEEAGIKDAGF
jgi:hypothetical protein